MSFRYKHISFYILITFCLFFVFVTSVYSPGGIDLKNYSNESSKGLFFWNLYQGKEFVSWFFIKISYYISDLVNLDKPVLILNLLMFNLISINLRSHKFKGVLLSLALISPFGVLLSQNVLRQYISCVFLFLFIVKIVEKKYLLALLLSFATFFSHNSSIIYLFPIFLSIVFNKKLIFLAMMVGVSFTILLLKYFEFNFGINNIEAAGEEFFSLLKFLVYFSLMILVWFAKLLFVRLEGAKLNFFYYQVSEKIDILFFSVLIIAFFELPFWVVNRFLLTVSFLIILYIVLLNNFSRKNMVFYVFFYLFILATCFMHPGARSILFY